MKSMMIAGAALVLMMPSAQAQDATAGAAVYKKLCLTCHDVGTKAKNKVGPILNGLNERKSGTVAGYNYSAANKDSGITWNEAVFLEYIKDPKAKIPNTKMVFAGIKAESDAKNLWAFIKQYDAEGNTK